MQQLFTLKLANKKTLSRAYKNLDKIKILNKELQNINQMSKTCITSLAEYPHSTLEAATKLAHTFNFSHSFYEKKPCPKRI